MYVSAYNRCFGYLFISSHVFAYLFIFAWRKDQHLDACLRYMQNQSVGKHLTLQVVKASCLEVLGAYEEVEGATVEEM